jgi:hypothetical protein
MADNPDKAIYLTYKTRMVAESRAKLASRALNILLAWYSFWVIAFAVLDLRQAGSNSHGLVIVILSIFVFGLSLIVPWLGLDEKASRHRECYLRLQKLRSLNIADDEKNARYHEILHSYPNHTDRDWDSMMVKAANRGQDLENNAKTITATKTQYWTTYTKSSFEFIAYLVFFTLPLYIMPTIS